MTPLPDTLLPGPMRARAALAACAAVLLVGACGGGSDDTLAPASDDAAIAEVSDSVDDRRFTLWAPGQDAAVRAEQAAIDADAPGSAEGDSVRLIVRLNPAAVFVNERLAMLASPGTGESGDAAAGHARRLAAKVQAVAAASQAVLSRSVQALAPGAVLRQQFSHAVEGFVLSVPAAQAEAVAAALATNPAVDDVEPDRMFSVGQSSPGVRTLDARAWGVDRIDQRALRFDNSFRHALGGSGVNVYVVDTGINPHDQFGSRLSAGFSAINDGRGTNDCNGHGTHVAGTAAGATLGVAPAAKLVPVRVMTCTGSSSGSSVLTGLDWVAAQGKRPAVVNLSLGGPASSAIDTAAQRLMTLGFSVVAAAGNDNRDACLQSPGRAAGAITVAASDRADAKAAFSNWGGCVALWAPGAAIASASHASGSAVVSMNGTSMAAPHVAGAVALLLQGNPSLAPAQVRQQLLAQATGDAVSGAPPGMTRSLLFAGQEGGTSASPDGPTPPTPAPAVASSVAVQSLTMSAVVPSVGTWKAEAAVKLVDDLGKAVPGAKVFARFSNAAKELSCTTAATGACTLVSANAAWLNVPLLGVAITQVKSTALAYTGGGARSAQVARPEAPRARVTALTGTMARAKPTAVNWVPQFMLTLQDQTLAPVAGAKVQAVMQVYSGSRIFGVKTLSCQTGATGQCKLAWSGARLDATHTGATVQILGVQRNFLSFQAGALNGASVGSLQ